MPDMNALRNTCQPEHEADAAVPVVARGVSDNADANVAEAEARWAALTDLPRSFDDLERHDLHRDNTSARRMLETSSLTRA